MLVDRRPEEDEYYQEWAELEPELGGQRDKKAPAGREKIILQSL